MSHALGTLIQVMIAQSSYFSFFQVFHAAHALFQNNMVHTLWTSDYATYPTTGPHYHFAHLLPISEESHNDTVSAVRKLSRHTHTIPAL